ncbi:DUF6923 family protein [Corynebacterium sp. CQ3829_602738]
MNPDGSRPRNVKRNYTVLQYRVDGVQGDNAFKPVNGNGVSPWVYNALAYNPADGYLYAVSQDRPQNGADSGLSNNNPDPQYPAGHLLRISPVTGKAESIGRVDGLVDVDVRSGITNGAFDLNGNYVFSNNSGNGTGDIYRVKFNGGSKTEFSIPEVTAAGNRVKSTRQKLGDARPTSANDWAYVGFDKSPYAWSINSENGHRYLYRTNVLDGSMIYWQVDDLSTPTDQKLVDGIYGNAWTYANGNLGFSVNGTGDAYQISVENPNATNKDDIKIGLVSVEKVPASYNNDATTNAITVQEYRKADVDLSIAKKLEMIDGQPQWTVTVTNNSGCSSSGFTVRDLISSGLSDVRVEPQTQGWLTQSRSTNGSINWTHGPLGAGQSATLKVNARVADGKCAINKVAVIGNEIDPTPANDVVAAGDCDPKLEIKKYINGQDAQDTDPSDWPELAVNGKITIRYDIKNTGRGKVTGIKLQDAVTAGERSTELQNAINVELAKVPEFDLDGGAETSETITVDVPLKTQPENDYKHRNSAFAQGTFDPNNQGFPTFNGGIQDGFTYDPFPQNLQMVSVRSNDDEANAVIPAKPPVVQNPKFAVEKIGLQAGGVQLQRRSEGGYAYSAEYIVRVRNTGDAEGQFAEVWDAPLKGAGFNITQFTVDGNQVQPTNGRYKVSDPATLAAGATRDFKVVVTGTLTDKAADALPAAVGQCDAVTPQNPGAGSGLVNMVTMEGDSDGPENNIVCQPVELRRLTVQKRINGYEDTALTAGEATELWYRVINTGNTTLTGITVADTIKEGNQALQAQIDTELQKINAFDLAPGAIRDIKITVEAPEGYHADEGRAEVPPTTITGTTNASSTVPGTTLPGITATATATANTPGISIQKLINGFDKNALVVPGQPMTITYRVANTGGVPLKGISLIDEVQSATTEPLTALQQEINAKLQGIRLDLQPGQVVERSITVTAPVDGHVNVAKPTVPPVTIPATTIPGTTIPNVTTVPETTVPERVVTPTTTPSDDASSTPVNLSILKEIRAKDTDPWLDAEAGQPAAVVTPGQDMQIRYTVTNTGKVKLTGIDIVDQVTSIEGSTTAERQALTDALNEALVTEGRGFELAPGEEKEVIVTVKAPKGAHVNVAKATAPEVPVTETVTKTVPGTTNATTTVQPQTETTVVQTTVTPPTPTNEARSTPTTSEVPPAVVPDPQFAVEKLNNQTGISLDRSENGQYGYSAEYTIRVRNTGPIAGQHAKVWDVPVRGVGFDITSVTVDDAEVKPDSGRYLISNEAELAVGEYKDYRVVVNGTVTDQAANALPAAVGQCDAVTPQNPGAGSGLVNVVTMEGDSDGRENNIVCEPVELRRLNIEKRIDGRENAPVTPGEPMEIWYRVSNTGNVTLSGITLADQITEDNKELQAEIDAEIAKIEAFDLAPGEVKDITFPVTAYEGEHTNEVRAQVPETTVPGTTRPETSIPETTVPPVTVPGTTNPETTVPGTTIPGSTVPATTIPGTTVPERPVPPTTVTATAHAGSPSLEVKKYINGRDEHAMVVAGEDMDITYRLTNTGAVRIDGIRLNDAVKEENPALQQSIDAQLGKVAPISLEPGESTDVTVTVKAPAGRHDNEVNVTVPPVTVPGTTIPETTAPPRTTVTTVDGTPTTSTIPGTPVPGTTVPPTVVTVTAPPDDAASDTVSLEILKEIKRATDGEDAWRDAETPADALPVVPGEDIQLRYTITNTGSVPLNNVALIDEVTELAEEKDKFQEAINKAIEAKLAEEFPDGINLEPGAENAATVEITVKAPKDYHVNVAKVTAPPVVTEETVVSSIPGTTEPGTTNPDTTVPGTTVPGTVTTETTQVTITPNTPTNKAQSTPIPPDAPQFAVEKFNAGNPGVTLERNDKGVYAYKAEYTIRVRNTGLVNGEHAKVWDVPVRGVGFAIDEVTVDGTKVDADNGRYLISDVAELDAGQYKDYRVVVDGTVTDEAAAALPAAVGQCKAVKPQNPGAGSGLVNVVTMEGDGDGIDNNIVCEPVELRRLNIEKRINGRVDAPVTPGEPMEIWYRVRNTGNVTLTDITLADQIKEDNPDLQKQINEKLATELAKPEYNPFNLEPGEYKDVKFPVKAPEGEHNNEVTAEVPPKTVPETTRPGTTVPGTTGPSTTIPPVTIPESTIPGTTEPGITVSTTARASSPKLSVKKFINGRDVHAVVVPGEDMKITYRLTNEGPVRIDGIRLTDKIEEANEDLQRRIDAQLGKFAPISLEPGQSHDVTITVPAPAGKHRNEVNVDVPPVTVPGTTLPGTTVPATVVTVTAPPDDAATDSVELKIKKYIRGVDGVWRDAEEAQDAAPVNADGTMDLRYVITNTGSLPLNGVVLTDTVEEMEGQQELQDAINAALEAKLAEEHPDGINLEPEQEITIELEGVKAPKVAHTNVAKVSAPPVVTEETVVSSIPGTTEPGTTSPDTTVPGTTVPGTVTTETTQVTITPNEPEDKAQSTPTTRQTPPPPVTETTTAPAPERPQFAVEKLAARAGNVELTRNDEGSYNYSNEYVIRVRNSGLVAGEHATIWDVPLRGAGFTVNEVTVDEKAVDVKNGRYKVADAAELKPGKYKDYKVTVTGTLAEAAANNLPEAVGQCTAEGANPGADSGLVNVVNMDGDTDGPGNNVVCTPVELRRLNIEKRINGREDASVTPGQKMEIWYRVRNTGNVELTDIAVADQIREDNQELQDEINAELAKKAEPFNLAPGAFQDIRIEVTAPKGEHVNEARAEVPETTVPGTTRPGTTIPGTTGPSTTVPPVTIPETTLPGRNVPGTTVSTTARANSPLLEVKKFINGRDEHALVTAGEDMDITYRVTNKGTLPIDGIRLTDEVKEDNAELQQAIDAQLGKVAPFALEPGESMDVTVTVKAPAGRHDNVAGVTVPPVTIPATTIPGTTNPHTTVPGTTVPSTVVTVTAPPDDASSDSPQLEILKEIKRADEGDDAWRDAETEGDALPIGEGETMELRYTVTNTGSVKLDGVDIVDNVTRLDGGDADEFTAEINKALESAGRGLSLEPGESVEIVIEVSAPAGYHVNEAIATAPPVTATETVVSSVPGTTNETTTVPGSFVTETTVVERTPNTPTNKAQSTPTTGVAPCDCEVKTTTIIPAPVTTTVSGEVTTVTPDPVTSEVTITETPEPVTSEVTTTETPEPIVTTVVQTQDPITVTRTTPVTTVQTVTPEPQTVVTTVEGPEVTTTPDVPGQVVVVVDDSGKTVTEVAPTPVDGYTPPVTATATYTLPPVVTETLPQITVTEVPTTLVTTKATVDEGTDILGRCVANAVRSPILYMVPLLLAGQVLGEVAAPYVNAVNEQFNQISAEIQDEIRRKTPNFGYGRRGQENEQVAELRAKAEAANRMLQELAMRPDVQQYGQWAAIAAGVVVAGSVLYDWCSNEAGEAFTAIGPKKSTSVDEVRVGGSSLGGDRVTTVVPPVTNTPGRDETAEDAGEAAGEAGSEAGSADGSSAGSSEGSSN